MVKSSSGDGERRLSGGHPGHRQGASSQEREKLHSESDCYHRVCQHFV